LLIAARVLQGLGAAALRVVAVSIVRDCYGGRQMARVMSLALMVFLLVPILAPTFGTLVLMVAPWRWIFGLLAAVGLAALAWVWLKLPETLHPGDRRQIDLVSVTSAWKIVVTDRWSVGYTIASTLIAGALFGFINSVQQITADIFHQPNALPFIFAAIGGSMAIGSLINSRIVERLGTRRVSHSGLIAYIVMSVAHLALVFAGLESLIVFGAMQALTMFCFSFCGANFGAMAMERVGHVAGAAASFQGSVSTVGGALAGFAIGQQFSGTTLPIVLGFTFLGVASLIAVLVTEQGRLFRPHQLDPAPRA
jgi:DHA1 family bicyclomycin/chloramphenicol resistance-like MFS transporter